jgi:citrate lyase subunit beta/citryl-CoA lyase
MIVPVRSMLFVPGDSERKIEKSRRSGADAVVLDLEDSVAPGRKTFARELVAATLRNDIFPKTTAVWVRINPLSSSEGLHDLAAVVPARPAGILQPKVDGPSDVSRLSFYLDALEVRDELPPGSIEILPVVTETARAPFSLGKYQDAGLTRLMGLTWGAEDLSAALGAFANTDEDGRWSLTYRTVRSLTLLAAKACDVQLIETLYADFRDEAGLRSSCIAARREGFTGRFAIHPDQVATINQAFSPGPEEIAFAERVVAAFAAQPDAGTLGLDGRMLDRPHLNQARLVLAMRDALQQRLDS